MRSTTPTAPSAGTSDSTPDTISDFNSAPNGRHIFTSAAANPPQPLTGGGILISERHGDIGWQMAIINDSPRVIWQRSWHAGDRRWRSWKKFTDAVLAERERSGELAGFEARLKAEIAAERGVDLASELDRRMTAEETARAAAITAAIDGLRAEIAADIPAAGMDRDAVRALVESEIADEREARIDSITLATSSIIQTRQAGIDAAVTAAIATERTAADARTDNKLIAVINRIVELSEDLAGEAAARTAADAEMKSELQSRMTADRDEFKRNLQRESAARTADIDAAKRAAAQAVTAEQAARTRAVADGDRAVKAELTADMTARIAAAETRMGGRIDGAGFPRGTRMLFQQSSAPTGWTKDTAQNDRALRVVSGAVGSGGSKGFAATFGRPRVSGSVTSRVSGRTAAHRLTVAEMPRHSHRAPQGNGGEYDGAGFGNTRPQGEGYVQSTGGDQPHSHGAGSLRVDSAFHGAELDLRVRYLDVIVAVKD